MTKQSILIIEDEVRIATWIRTYCERAGYATLVAHDGADGLQQARTNCPDLIVLDLMLPYVDGLEICRILRQESAVPIIMLTAKGDHPDRITGLDVGADDYITKPFDPKEVVARIRAVLRRVNGRTQQVLAYGHIVLNEDMQQVEVGNRQIPLTPIQFDLLAAFMRHPNQVLTRSQLIEIVFHNDFDAFDRAIDNHIKRLRKQITHEGIQPIQTVYGQGYRFAVEELL